MKTKITLLLFTIITAFSARSQDNVTNFSVSGKFKVVSINWSLSPDNDIKSFEIQRGTDSTAFITIRTISDDRINGVYEYTDQPPVNKVIYYRLKSVSNSGKVQLSKIRFVNLIGTSSLTLYPNLISGCTLNIDSNDKLLVNIFTSAGINISRNQLVSGHNNVDVSRLTNGMYFLQNTANGEMLKFIVSK